MKDMTQNKAVQLLAPADITNTDTETLLLDTQGFEGAGIIVNVGALTGHIATAYADLVVQECDTTADADFTDVDAADLIGTLPQLNSAASDDLQLYSVCYIGRKRYIRLSIEVTEAVPGTISAMVIGVTGVLSFARHMPALAPVAVAAT